MQDIKEMIFVLRQKNVQPLNINGQSVEKDSKLWGLYDGIAKGKYQSDDDAAQNLYGGSSDTVPYRKLKSTLREKLIDTIGQINPNQVDYSDYQRAYYDSHRLWVVVKILTGQNANTAALSLAGKLLKQTDRYDFVLLSMDIASFLRVQYGLREGNDKKYREANEMFEHYSNAYLAESQAEKLYTSLVVNYVNNRSPKGEVHETAEQNFAEIRPLMEQYDTYRLHMYGRMIGLICFTSVHDYAGALELCDEAIRFFENKPYEARVPLQIFYYQKLVCHIQLKQFQEGERMALKCVGLMQEGTFNWFKYLELYFQLSMHTGEFQKAAKVLQQAMEHPRFQFLPEHAVESWRIYEAYVHYLGMLGKVVPPKNSKFRLARFINETPIFSKDKSGMNIAIVSVKLLFLLAEKKYSQLIDEVEPTEQYCYRYLNGKNTQRSYNFMKMLLQIPLGHFDLPTIQKKSERYLDKLRNIPLQIANQTHEIEIIPYEDLWQFALESVETNQKR